MTLPEAPETKLMRPMFCGIEQDIWIGPREVQAFKVKTKFTGHYNDMSYSKTFILILRGGAEFELSPSLYFDDTDEGRAGFERSRHEIEEQFWPSPWEDPYRT